VRYSSPTTEELFNMLTKETPETLYIGKLITATVVGKIYSLNKVEKYDRSSNSIQNF
jgi:transcription elongation factor SPT6